MNTKRKYKRGNLAKSNIPIKPIGNKQINDLTNQKFGKLLIINPLGINYKRSVVWECQCECGQKTNVSSESLMAGRTQSCGCITIQRLQKVDHCKSSFDVGSNKIYGGYKYHALDRNLEFSLTLDDFKNIITQNCYYCGRSPQNVCKLPLNREFIYNGIDRIENHIGYKNDNILPCCIICNRMKMDLNVFEFSNYIRSLVEHSKTWIKGLK